MIGWTPVKKITLLEEKLDDTKLGSLPVFETARVKLEDARAALQLEGGARTAKVNPKPVARCGRRSCCCRWLKQ